jgi:hypothetical protein
MYEILFDEYESEAVARIRLTDGPFYDIIFHINSISAEKIIDGVLSFDYGIDSGIVPAESIEEFERVIGDILIEIIEEHFEEEHGNRE